jgi:hypothetical protein
MKWWCLACGWQSAENAPLPKACPTCGKRMQSSGVPVDGAEGRLQALCEEVRRIMTTMSEPAAVEMLQDALDAWGVGNG